MKTCVYCGSSIEKECSECKNHQQEPWYKFLTTDRQREDYQRRKEICFTTLLTEEEFENGEILPIEVENRGKVFDYAETSPNLNRINLKLDELLEVDENSRIEKEDIYSELDEEISLTKLTQIMRGRGIVSGGKGKKFYLGVRYRD